MLQAILTQWIAANRAALPNCHHLTRPTAESFPQYKLAVSGSPTEISRLAKYRVTDMIVEQPHGLLRDISELCGAVRLIRRPIIATEVSMTVGTSAS
jgi:hypothetical protein